MSGIFVHSLASQCNASNLMFEILKHDKIREAICISVFPVQILDDSSYPFPVIYAREWPMAWIFCATL